LRPVRNTVLISACRPAPRDLLVAVGCVRPQRYRFARRMSAAAPGLWAATSDGDDGLHAAFANALFADSGLVGSGLPCRSVISSTGWCGPYNS